MYIYIHIFFCLSAFVPKLETKKDMTTVLPHLSLNQLGSTHTATHGNTLQHTTTYCHILYHTATHCSTLQHAVPHLSLNQPGSTRTATHCNILQHTATHCNTLHLAFAHLPLNERWGAGVETQKNVRGEIGGWGRVPFNDPYAPSLSTIYDGA